MIPFSIVIADDKKKETNETFSLAIDPHPPRDGVVVVTPENAIITIVDANKCKLMHCSYSNLFMCIVFIYVLWLLKLW